MDRIAMWNVRGLNAPNKQKELLYFCNKQRVGLLGTAEIELRSQSHEVCYMKQFSSYGLFNNFGDHAGGRLWVF